MPWAMHISLVQQGLIVQQEDVSSADWKSGFDSRWSTVGQAFEPDSRDVIAVRLESLTYWKVAGYGWPGRSAKAVLQTEMRVRLPCLPLRRENRS